MQMWYEYANALGHVGEAEHGVLAVVGGTTVDGGLGGHKAVPDCIL